MLPVPITNSAPYVRMRATTTPSPNTQSVSTTQKRQPTQMKTSEPDMKQPTHIPRLQQVKLPDNIGKYVAREAEEVTRHGWMDFVRQQQGQGDFSSLLAVEHPARRLLWQYKHRGAPVMLMMG